MHVPRRCRSGAKVTDACRDLPPHPLFALVTALGVLGLLACTEEPTTASLRGETIEVIAVWQDAEAEAFEQVLEAFEDRTGATVEFTSTAGRDIALVLDERLAEGTEPDVAILPQVGLLPDLAARGVILPLDDLVGDEVRTRYAPEWQRLGSVDGQLYAVWFKAANKSLVWYSIGAFEQAGVIPPADLEGLVQVARNLTASGTPAFALPGAPSDAWTLTDLFENVYLRLAGSAQYDALATHRIPWTDPSVEEALATFASLLAPGQVATLPTDSSFPDSVQAVFSREPAAAMIVEGDFVPGVVAGRTDAELGVDVDVFAFPEPGRERHVVGGGDAAVLMRASPGGEELVRYLASAEAAETWARLGGFVSPNESVDLAAYPDETTRQIARALLDAGGGGFRFDLSDLQPASFGGGSSAALWVVLREVVTDPSDLAAAARRLEDAAAAAWAGRARDG